MNIGALYDYAGGNQEALDYYGQALQLVRAVKDRTGEAAALACIGGVYAHLGKRREAIDYYEKALQLRRSVGDRAGEGATLNGLAVVYADEGKYTEAEDCFKRSLAIGEQVRGREHPAIAIGLQNLAALYWAQGKYLEAAPLFERANENLSRQFESTFAYMSEKDRLAFLGTASSTLPAHFSFFMNFRQQMPNLAGKAYDLLLWEKGMVANSVAAQRARIAASGDAGALQLLDQLTAKKNQYAAVAGSHPSNYDEWRKLLDQVGEEANELEKQLARRSSAFAGQEKMLHPSWRDVQKSLQPDEAAVELVRFHFYDGKKWTDTSYYVALVLRHESVQPAFVVLGEAKDLESTPLGQYRRGVVLARGFTVKEEAREAGAGDRSAFYNALWKPLEPALAGIHRIYLAPDGVLNQVALGVVRDEQDRLLIERYDLRTVNSTKDLLREHREASNKDAVLVGNPKFLLSEEQERAALQQLRQGKEKATVLLASATTPSGAAGAQSRDLRAERGTCSPPPPPGGTICPLPGTAKEIEAVSELLKKTNWQVSIYHDETALEDVVKGVRHPRVLHLATHGFFLADQKATLRSRMMGEEEEKRATGMEDPMLRSGVLLAGADRVYRNEPAPKDLDDGVLTAYEASTLDLQGTELVVLSACETGLGEQQNGEGVFGLRRGLQEAGADGVMMSMWSVPDQETQELMTKFYGKWLSGMEKHEALRQAQLEERETVRKRYGKDLPYYWGAFVLVGR